MTRSSIVKISGALVLTVAVAVPIYFSVTRWLAPKPDESAGYGTVKRADLIQRVTVAGNISANRKSIISAPYNGYVKKVYVKLGQMVQAGEPVVSLVESLNGEYREVFPLRAPISGRVVQILHDEGEYVEQLKETNGLVRIDDLSRMFVKSDVPEADITKIRVGQPVVIRINANPDRTYDGIIRNISLASKEKKQMDVFGDKINFEVTIEINKFDERVLPGMTAIIDVITNQRLAVLTLPHEFVEKRKENFSVTLPNGEKRKITVGLQNEEFFEIVSGLNENEKVSLVDFYKTDWVD
jgi:multidrug efflux pump subunit AcrA (membrane-fusion protein)